MLNTSKNLQEKRLGEENNRKNSGNKGKLNDGIGFMLG